METPGPDAAGIQRTRATRVFLCFWLLWGLMILAIRVAHPGLELGDGLNDADILHSSAWFEQHGYRESTFLPVRETAFHPDYWASTYNTFPPGVFYVHEALRVAGLRELWAFRIVSVLWAQAAIWLWFVLVRRLTGNAWIAFAAGVLYMLGRPYLSYAAGFWEHLPMLTLFGTLVAWMRMEQSEGASVARRWLLVAMLVNFLDNWLTVQHACLIALVIGGRAVVHVARGGSWKRLVGAALVCAMPAVVLALRFWHQVAHSGRVAPAIAYFKESLEYRLGESETGYSRVDVIGRWLFRLGAPNPEFPPAEVIYPIFHWSALALAAVPLAILISRWKHPEHKPYRLGVMNGLLLFAGAMTWPLVMKQHAQMHAFPVLMFMPGAALMIATLMVFAFHTAGAFTRGDRRIRRAHRPGTMPLAVKAALVIGAACMAWPLVRDLRRSDTLNRVVSLDRRTHDNIRRVVAREPIVRAAGERMPAASVVRFSPRWPTLTYWLGQRFYQTRRPLDMRPVPGEMHMLDLNDREMSRVASSFALERGIPDLAADPGRLALFPPVVSAGDPMTLSARPDVAVLPGVRLVEVRWALSLDGSAGIASVLLDGAMSRAQSDGLRIVMLPLDADGEAIDEQSGSAESWRTRAVAPNLGYLQKEGRPALLAWFEFPMDIWERAAGVRFELSGTADAAYTLRREGNDSAAQDAND